MMVVFTPTPTTPIKRRCEVVFTLFSRAINEILGFPEFPQVSPGFPEFPWVSPDFPRFPRVSPGFPKQIVVPFRGCEGGGYRCIAPALSNLSNETLMVRRVAQQFKLDTRAHIIRLFFTQTFRHRHCLSLETKSHQKLFLRNECLKLVLKKKLKIF